MTPPTLTRWRCLLPHLAGQRHSNGPFTYDVDDAGCIVGEVSEALAARLRLFPREWRLESYPDPSWTPTAESSAASAAPNTAPEAVELAPALEAPEDPAAAPDAVAAPAAPLKRGPGRPKTPRG